MADASSALLTTPLHAAHVQLKARMTGFGGWDMPLSYAGQLIEHQAVRTKVGIFDVSHMGQVRFSGDEALPFLQMLVPANIAALTDGGSKYTQLCNDHGGVIDDLIVSRLRANEYFAVVNASTRVGDVEWMRQKARDLGYGSLRITDESASWAMIAVQGPEALTLLDKLIPARRWSETPAFTLHPFVDHGEIHLLSRTGYTGEIGGELLCPEHLAEQWWETLLDAGAVPCGLAARDSLRLEAGYCLYGNDLDQRTTPVEAGLSWSVGWSKPEKFIGRTMLEKHRKDGPPRRLIGLRTDTRKPLRHGDKVLRAGEEIGEVTSGGYSPVLECGIALAYVRADAAKEPTLDIQSKTATQPATVVKPPFVKTSLSKS